MRGICQADGWLNKRASLSQNTTKKVRSFMVALNFNEMYGQPSVADYRSNSVWRQVLILNSSSCGGQGADELVLVEIGLQGVCARGVNNE
jgi:hypothetical protein